MGKNMRKGASRWSGLVLVLLCLMLLPSCAARQWMHDQAKAEPLESSPVFADGSSSRALVPGTVAHNPTMQFVAEDASVGEILTDEHLNTGMVDGEIVDTFPFTITREVIERGHERYDIYCAPCHGLSGYGDGMVARRGGTPPANYHVDRLRDLTLVMEKNPEYELSLENPDSNKVGHVFRVITYGWRNMWSYGAKITPEDRWAIAAYIRTLQYSQYQHTPDDE